MRGIQVAQLLRGAGLQAEHFRNHTALGGSLVQGGLARTFDKKPSGPAKPKLVCAEATVELAKVTPPAASEPCVPAVYTLPSLPRATEAASSWLLPPVAAPRLSNVGGKRRMGCLLSNPRHAPSASAHSSIGSPGVCASATCCATAASRPAARSARIAAGERRRVLCPAADKLPTTPIPERTAAPATDSGADGCYLLPQPSPSQLRVLRRRVAAMLRAVVLCAVFAAPHGAAALDPAQSAFSCKGCVRCPNQQAGRGCGIPTSTSGNHNSRSGDSLRESQLRGRCSACRSATPTMSIPRAELFRPARRPKTYVQPVVNVVHVLGKRLYVASTGPSIPAGAGGGFTLTVNGQTGSVWPQVRLNATMGTVRAASVARGCRRSVVPELAELICSMCALLLMPLRGRTSPSRYPGRSPSPAPC